MSHSPDVENLPPADSPRPGHVEKSTSRPDTVRLDAAVVTELYVKYAEELRAFLLGVLCNLDLANEVLQVTFLKVVEVGHTAREESIKGWLFRVAFNEAMTSRRRAMVRTKAAVALREQGEPQNPPPEEAVFLGEQTARVQTALAELTPDLRKIVKLRMFEDKTFATIAAELNVPLGTVYARLQLAFKKLKSLLNEGN